MCKKLVLLMVFVLVFSIGVVASAGDLNGYVYVGPGQVVNYNERMNMIGNCHLDVDGGTVNFNGDLKFPDNKGDNVQMTVRNGGYVYGANVESRQDERSSYLHISTGTFKACSIGECNRTPSCDTDWNIDCFDGCTGPNFQVEGNCEIVTCECGPPDADGDGIPDDGDASGIVGDSPCTGGETEGCDDNCLNTPNPDQADTDEDEVGDACDVCEGYDDNVDTDGDTVPDGCDNCPNDQNTDQADMDEDGVGDVCDDDVDGDGCEVDPGYDDCPLDATKCEAGVCGCGVPDVDSDGDGTEDCIDGCPDDPNKTEPGLCGCGVPDDDIDGDGVVCDDNCPDVPNPNQENNDGDSCGDACDECDDDPDKCEAGECGCGVPETGDTDGDGVHDCNEDCPNDPGKTEPGICGCGVADESPNTDDDDGDGVENCIDVCPGEDDNADADEDGVPDACDNCPCDANPDQAESDNPDCGAACYVPGGLIEITGETVDSDEMGRGDEGAWEIWLISDNTGMHADGVTHDQCDTENAWLTWGMPSYLTFDLQQVYSLSKMRVWNNHYSPPRGVCHAKIWHSENGSDWTELGTYDWDEPPSGGPFQYDDEVDLGNVGARYVKWTDIQPCDSGRTQVGLGEVIFYTSEVGGCTDDADGDGSEYCLDCDDDPEACGAACGPDLIEDTANANCTDGYDNDCDGLVDHDDPGCGCACPGDVDGDGWMSPKDVSDLVNELLPHASNSYWLEVADPPDCGDVDEDDWKSPKDVSDLVNTLLPHASNSYWLLCP